MGHTRMIVLLFLILSFSLVVPLFATEEYATSSGQDCALCHLDPAGGGELTASGEGFALSLLPQPGSGPVVDSHFTASDGFRLLIGYLHILFGVFWFGTILYVHLILKPGYASRGLPRGEVKLGLLSMLVMAVTGSILMAYRVPSFDLLFSSRFGILLLIKIGLFLLMVGSAMFAVFFLGPRLRNKQTAAPVGDPDSLSLEELAGYDGKEGRVAYFAFGGTVYDATNSPLWENGTHMGRHQAGCDLTEVLSQAPHGSDKILALPEVGTLRIAEAAGMSAPQKLFYFMAYMNLSIVLLIILILALWKWS